MPGYPRPARTPATPLRVLAELLHTSTTAGEVVVTGATLASAEVRPGDLYAALPGSRRHGAEFIGQAAAAGAVAVLTDAAGAPGAVDAGLPVLVVEDPRARLGEVAARVYGDPSHHLQVIGVTGTAGKTSTVYLVESGLRAAGIPAGLIGTVETRLGDAVVDSTRTTPEAPDLHALFAAAIERGVRAVAMEVSSHALALGRVGGVRFAVAGYSNFGSDHLDFHADAADYFAAKAALFDGRAAIEVLNADDPALAPLRRPDTVTFSLDGDATWRATDVAASGTGMTFTAHGPDGFAAPASVATPGRHSVANALLALAVLAAAGIDPKTAVDGIAACPGVPGRLERVSAPGPVLGYVDYAHKADAVVAVLDALHRTGRRIVCVLGAGGDRDTEKRPVMGAAAASRADVLIVTDDNPRTEDPAQVRAGILRGATGGAAEVVEVAGRRAAIVEAVARARPGDVVAVLGKGHERGQEIDGVVHPFDDRVELAAALAARFGGGA